METRKLSIGLVVVVLLAAAAWALGLFGGTDPAVAELQEMRDQMFASRDLPEAQREQLRDQFRQRLEGLSDDQRRALFQSGRNEWRQRAQQRMDEFFSLPPPQRQKQLDDMINRMLARSNERRQNSPGGDRNARQGGGERGDGRGRGRNATEAQRDAWRKQRLDRSSPKERAQRDEFRRQIRERMEQRGLNPDSFRGRGGGGRGWRGMA